MTKYSQEFKEEIIRKKLSGTPVIEISKETGVSDVTIYKWTNDKINRKSHKKIKYPGNYSFEEKYNLLTESYTIPAEKKGEWLRKKGVHTGHLEKWSEEIKSKMTEPNKYKEENKKLREELRKTQKELKKKDKALAEAAALLVLKKKYQHLWEDEEK